METEKNGQLNPMVEPLRGLLSVDTKKMDDCMGEEVELAVKDLTSSDVLLLENNRFYRQDQE